MQSSTLLTGLSGRGCRAVEVMPCCTGPPGMHPVWTHLGAGAMCSCRVMNVQLEGQSQAEYVLQVLCATCKECHQRV